MKIGWVDFSEKDRRRALDVIHLLHTPGSMDELGIGIVRDAFANRFFPGTSTVQTRAKYFFIVPYAMMEACANPRYTSPEMIARAVNRIEKECAEKMGNREGVIGRQDFSQWVVRTPSSIYWNGLKRLGIFTQPKLSTKEYYRLALANRQADRSSDDGDDAGCLSFWNLPPEHQNGSSWRDDGLQIELQSWEARWLRKCISKNLEGTLLKHIVDHNIDLRKFDGMDDPFRALSNEVSADVTDELRDLMTLANRFNSLVYLCLILYNLMLSENKDSERASLLENELEKRIDEVEALDIAQIFTKLHPTDNGAKRFLKKMQSLFISGDRAGQEKCLIERETKLKQSRAKLIQHDKSDSKWVGGKLLDFRFRAAARIINDIYSSEQIHDV